MTVRCFAIMLLLTRSAYGLCFLIPSQGKVAFVTYKCRRTLGPSQQAKLERKPCQ